ncbi:MAG: hypothetical protein EBY86_01305 [Acidimicrobiia bacterium]|nr:hypothetical protein [Acidimicrobiia bacterium]
MNLTDSFGIRVGKNVTIEVDDLRIGDGVWIQDNVVLEGPKIHIGDYTVLGNGLQISGKSPCQIGMSCWIGPDSRIDASGKVDIDNGVGIATGCQLWTHMRFGDTLQGCRFEWYRDLKIEEDVYIGGNALLGPIHAGRRSAALLGAVVTNDMQPNRVYAGVPAIDITDRVGPHYVEVSTDLKYQMMVSKLQEFNTTERRVSPIEIVKEWPEVSESDVSYFNVSTREYTKRGSEVEFRFMLFLLTPIKFYPVTR